MDAKSLVTTDSFGAEMRAEVLVLRRLVAEESAATYTTLGRFDRSDPAVERS